MTSTASRLVVTFTLSSLLRSRMVPSGNVPGEALTTFHLPTTTLGLSFSSPALISTASIHSMIPAPIRPGTFMKAPLLRCCPEALFSWFDDWESSLTDSRRTHCLEEWVDTKSDKLIETYSSSGALAMYEIGRFRPRVDEVTRPQPFNAAA